MGRARHPAREACQYSTALGIASSICSHVSEKRPLDRQGFEGLPPRLYEVEVGRVLGLENELPARVGGVEHQHVVGLRLSMME